jgi:hypothetical protein
MCSVQNTLAHRIPCTGRGGRGGRHAEEAEEADMQRRQRRQRSRGGRGGRVVRVVRVGKVVRHSSLSYYPHITQLLIIELQLAERIFRIIRAH